MDTPKSKISFKKIAGICCGGLVLLFIIAALSGGGSKTETQTKNNVAENKETIQGTQSASQFSQNLEEPKEAETLYKVVRVVDGDTIEIEGGQKVRYIGIDTPETVDPSKSVQCFGKEASDKNKELVEGKMVKLEKDVSETDQYDRLLRYVYVNGTFVNDYLVRQGYAHASTYPPDVKYQDQFTQAEKEARESSRGLWGNACACEKGKEKSRACSACNKATVSKTYWNCDTYTEEISDTGCISGCSTPQTPQPSPAPSSNPTPTTTFTCNCNKTCAQMASCDEAYYQLTTCGCAQRDGDNDGVPCEDICSGGEANNTPAPTPTPTPTPSYACNCNKTCPQMSSCEEAYYQLNTCGCKKRDGDGDGVPCEDICPGG